MAHMEYLQVLLIFGVVGTLLQPGSGFFTNGYGKKECPAKPAGLSSFRPAVGTRFYYAWSTVQGSAKKSFLSNTQCRGGKILDCSCIGYDVVSYEKSNVETQNGYTFSVNKKLGVSDLYKFSRDWGNSGDYNLKCHYTTNYQFGEAKKTHKHHGPYKQQPDSYTQVWTKNTTSVHIDKHSVPFKVLSWTATEVVFYNCASSDPDIRIYTTYIPKSKSSIPYTVFDILAQVGININTLRWFKIDHKNCVYPSIGHYAKLGSKKPHY